MRIGVVFPQNQIGNDPATIRAFAREAEGLGFAHLLAFDHVIGRPDTYAGQPFHEIMALLAHLAAVTSRIELVPGVIVLPQRQTALAAKQLATIDLLSGGRLRVGVGVGWAEEEYAAMGMPFNRRERRMDRQLEALAALFAGGPVTVDLDGERFRDVALNPPPARRPPIWIGGRSEAAARRVARLGDGWLLNLQRGVERDRAEFEVLVGWLDRELQAAGRPRAEVGLETWLPVHALPEQRWGEEIAAWAALGVTHLSVRTEDRERRREPAEHLALLRRFAARHL